LINYDQSVSHKVQLEHLMYHMSIVYRHTWKVFHQALEWCINRCVANSQQRRQSGLKLD